MSEFHSSPRSNFPAKHKSKNWRAFWTLDLDTKVARHASGVVSIAEDIGDGSISLTVSGYKNIDTEQWNLTRILDESVRIWIPKQDLPFKSDQVRRMQRKDRKDQGES